MTKEAARTQGVLVVNSAGVNEGYATRVRSGGEWAATFFAGCTGRSDFAPKTEKLKPRYGVVKMTISDYQPERAGFVFLNGQISRGVVFNFIWESRDKEIPTRPSPHIP